MLAGEDGPGGIVFNDYFIATLISQLALEPERHRAVLVAVDGKEAPGRLWLVGRVVPFGSPLAAQGQPELLAAADPPGRTWRAS